MFQVVQGKYKDLKFVGKDVYGYKHAYSIIPIKLTANVELVRPVTDTSIKALDVGIAVGVSCVDLLAGILTLGLLSKRQPKTYQVVINGASHFIQTDETLAISTLDRWSHKYK